MTLNNKTKDVRLANELFIAKNLFQRIKGFIGYKPPKTSTALWIKKCNSVHTFFMQFPIDIIFVDKNLIVKAIFINVSSRRLILPVWKASSVFEVAQNKLISTLVEKGDQLHVDY